MERNEGSKLLEDQYDSIEGGTICERKYCLAVACRRDLLATRSVLCVLVGVHFDQWDKDD